MDIELNKPVFSSDGEEIGTVDRLIIDQDTMKVREFVMQQGTFLSTDRVVNIEQVANVASDGTVHLTIASDEAENLQPFVENRYVQPRPEQIDLMPQTWAAAGAGGGALFWGPASPGRGYAGEGSMFEPAPSDPPEMRPADSVDQQSAVLAEGTEVRSSDGESLGTINEVSYDASGRIASFTTERGWISSDKLTLSMDLVESYGPDGVQLSVTANEAESAGATS